MQGHNLNKNQAANGLPEHAKRFLAWHAGTAGAEPPPPADPDTSPRPTDARPRDPRPTHTPDLAELRRNELPPVVRWGTPEEVTRHLTAGLEQVYSDVPVSVWRLYRLLHLTAVMVAKAKGYSTKATHIAFTAPIEVVAALLGVHRVTVWRHLGLLKGFGLVDWRAHKTTSEGLGVVNDGTVFSVRLHPTRGRRARVRYDDLKTPYRNLDRDRKRGRTAYRFVREHRENRLVQQSQGVHLDSSAAKTLLAWTLSPPDPQTSSNVTVAKTSQGDVYAVRDAKFAPRAKRNEVVDQSARAVAAALGDPSVAFYRALIWNLLRLYDRGQDYFTAVLNGLLRAKSDRAEGFARKPGALFVSRLKAVGLYDCIMNAPPWRVGEQPQA